MKNLKNETVKIARNKVVKDPNYDCTRTNRTYNYLVESFEQFGTIIPPVVTPNPSKEGYYFVLDGWAKVKNSKSQFIDCIVVGNLNETDKVRLIVDLNKSKNKSGEEKRIEFEFISSLYESNRGVKGTNRAEQIGAEFDMDSERVRDLQTLCNFFNTNLFGNGVVILNQIFGNTLSINKANQIKNAVKKYPEKFTKKECFDKLANPDFDFRRLGDAVELFDIDNEAEFKIIKQFLLNEIDYFELVTTAEKLGKTRLKVDKHNEAKLLVPNLTIEYRSQNAYIINEDNKLALNKLPNRVIFKAIIGSPPYGIKRLYGSETIPRIISGSEWAIEMADTYELYKKVLDPTGSIYVILDDYMTEEGDYECSLEYFVIEMRKRGFYLVGRYSWQKNNAIPTAHSSKKFVNSFEMVYRFVLDPKNYFTNPNLYEEIVLPEGLEFEVLDGCTNPNKKGTTRGGQYVQGQLKKIRNVLDERKCLDIIKSNVLNQNNFFRQAGDLKHTAGSPIELTSCLILECTSNDPNETILDIWNGVGGTCESSLLMGKKYVGVELDQNYCDQTNKRIQGVEVMMSELKENVINSKIAA